MSRRERKGIAYTIGALIVGYFAVQTFNSGNQLLGGGLGALAIIIFLMGLSD